MLQELLENPSRKILSTKAISGLVSQLQDEYKDQYGMILTIPDLSTSYEQISEITFDKRNKKDKNRPSLQEVSSGSGSGADFSNFRKIDKKEMDLVQSPTFNMAFPESIFFQQTIILIIHKELPVIKKIISFWKIINLRIMFEISIRAETIRKAIL